MGSGARLGSPDRARGRNAPGDLAGHERTPPPRNRLTMPALPGLIELFALAPDLRRATGSC